MSFPSDLTHPANPYVCLLNMYHTHMPTTHWLNTTHFVIQNFPPTHSTSHYTMTNYLLQSLYKKRVALCNNNILLILRGSMLFCHPYPNCTMCIYNPALSLVSFPFYTIPVSHFVIFLSTCSIQILLVNV